MAVKNIFDLSGKVAVVTGGGRGLGKGMALALANAGADIAVADINAENAKAVSEEITALGRKSIFIEIDIVKKSQAEQMVKKIVKEFNHLDIAVNSVGIPGSRLPSAELIEESDARRFIDIMLLGTFFCCQEQAKQMIMQKKGRIINISSVSSVIVNKGITGLAPYCAVKAGLVHMSQALAADWAQHNITVNCISPGYMLTPATEAIMPQREKMYSEQALLNRIGLPEDLDGAVVFLASDASGFTTGHNLLVDGGVAVW
ncbi:MAG: SDR family oxidoreductase [Actinomycetota bacterium]